jgi:hypothetical protein
MKTKFSFFALLLASSLLILSSCGEKGPAGRNGIDGQDGIDGVDGNANVIYSPWITPTVWNGQTGDWYFDVSNSAISQDIVESGVILAYVSLPDDIYASAVRPLPAYALGCNWDYLIPDYGEIEFLCDALNKPGTANYYFRFVLIPSNIPLKSSAASYTAEDLKKMSYLEVCKKFGIPE